MTTSLKTPPIPLQAKAARLLRAAGLLRPRSPRLEQQPAASLTLRSLYRQYRGRMLFTYALFNVENLLKLVQPFVVGLAINDLLKSSYVGLMLLVVQHLAHLLISSFRQMYDTRAFTGIYTDLATELIVEQRSDQVEVSRVAARSALSREYVEFFERYVPMMIRALYAVVGAVVVLGLYDWVLVPFCLALVVPAVLLNAAYGKRTFDLSRLLHDDLEREVDVIQRGDEREIRRYFNSVAHWRIKLSDAEAINFSLMELFVLGVLAASLVQFVTANGPQPGDIFAVFRYLLMFLMGMDRIPMLVQQTSRLKDIGSRMRRRGR